MRLQPYPPPAWGLNRNFRSIPPGSLYRVSLCNSIFNKDILESLLQIGENAWEFEFKGSDRSSILDGFYSSTKPLFKYINTIEKGKWSNKIIKHLTDGTVDFRIRGIYKLRFTQINLLSFIKQFLIYTILPNKYQSKFLRFYQNCFNLNNWN
jgi:hypothetical protein